MYNLYKFFYWLESKAFKKLSLKYRLAIELLELVKKRAKLARAISAGRIPSQSMHLAHAQLKIMDEYCDILRKRIEVIK